jgi:hypothetical protein
MQGTHPVMIFHTNGFRASSNIRSCSICDLIANLCLSSFVLSSFLYNSGVVVFLPEVEVLSA